MTIFGPEWDELTLQDVQAYLDQAEDEPLLWEAKGTRIDKNEVRTQVCGFANSHEGGYLILGADKTDDGWKANGVAFDGEPTTWLSDVIGDPERGVRPRPDFDIRAWPADNGHVAVIRIRSTSTPPCIANGTVYMESATQPPDAAARTPVSPSVLAPAERLGPTRPALPRCLGRRWRRRRAAVADPEQQPRHERR